MSAHNEALAMATATLLEIVARGKATQAAVIRGDSFASQEHIRREAHDLLDAYIDQMGDAAQHSLSILKGRPDAARLIADGLKRLPED